MFQDTKYEALIEQLDRYSKQGTPQNFDYSQGQCESIDALYKLEDDWKDIITEFSGEELKLLLLHKFLFLLKFN